MKKLLLACALVCLSVPASAEEFYFKPYVGFDAQNYSINYQDDGEDVADDSLWGGNVHAGFKFHPNFGLELGYFQTKKGDKDNVLGTGIDTSVKLKGFTLDLLGYAPLMDRLEGIGTIGVSHIKAEYDVDAAALGIGSFGGDETEWGYRAGLGLQYDLNQNINFRGIARYQSADFEDSTDNVMVYSAGLNFTF